jgi:hypothetical protein
MIFLLFNCQRPVFPKRLGLGISIASLEISMISFINKLLST